MPSDKLAHLKAFVKADMPVVAAAYRAAEGAVLRLVKGRRDPRTCRPRPAPRLFVISDWDRWMAICEGRPCRMSWIWCQARA